MANTVAEYLFVFAFLVRITAGKLTECGSDQKVLHGIVAVDIGCHEGCAKLEIACPGYKCACFLKKDGRCMLNVKRIRHYRDEACEKLTDSSNQGSRIYQLSNVVAPDPKESEEETALSPRKESEKEGKPKPSVEAEPSTGVEPQPSVVGPKEEHEAVRSEVPVELDLFQHSELELDAEEEEDRNDKMPPKTEVVSKKKTKESVDEETRVLHELFSLENGFNTHLALGEDMTNDIDIVSREIAYESFNDDVMIADLVSERRKRLVSRKGLKKRSFVDVKDEALNGAEANEVVRVIA